MINKNKLEFRQVSSKELFVLMRKYHYLHRRVATKFSYGLYYQNELVGMVTYSPVRISLARSISDKATKDNTLELSRLYIKDEVSQTVPNITSEFVGWSLRQLKQQGNWYIISFADSGMHHTGAIYQATNFLYCGQTKEGIYCYNGPGKKGGQWERGHHYRFFISRSRKYRYVKFIGSKSFKKYARRELKFELRPYPKHDNQHYRVGDVEERFIRDRKTNKVYPESELLKAFPDYDWDGNEVWKDFYDYKVSSFGRIFSIKSNRYLSPFKHNYSYIDLTINGEVKKYSVHRLVATLFIPNPDNLPDVNHIDENRFNNRADNLEWCTAKYNTNYGTAINRIIDTKYKKGLTTPIYAINTKTNKKIFFKSIKQCSKTLGVGERNIKRCLVDHKGSLRNYAFCCKNDYNEATVKKLIAKAKSSSKYERDYIIDGQWVTGSKDAQIALGVTRSSLSSAIRDGRSEVKGHKLIMPTDEQIKQYYLADGTYELEDD